MIRFLEIQIFDVEKEPWAQGRYLVHGHNDVLWTDSIEYALAFLRQSMGTQHDQD